MSIKNSNHTIGNRTRDLTACGAVPHPTLLNCDTENILVIDCHKYFLEGRMLAGTVSRYNTNIYLQETKNQQAVTLLRNPDTW